MLLLLLLVIPEQSLPSSAVAGGGDPVNLALCYYPEAKAFRAMRESLSLLVQRGASQQPNGWSSNQRNTP